MHRLIFLILALGALVTFDLIRTISTGRAHGKFGVITRKGRPDRFRRYVYGDWIILALCAGTTLWMLISPETFQQ